MAQKVKTQDLMEVFNEKLDEVNLKFDLNKEIISTLDKKLEEIENSSLKIEFEPLEKVILENSKSFEKHRDELARISKEHNEKIKTSAKKEVKYQLYFYGALTILFCLCTAFLSFGINQYQEKKYAEKELKFYSKEALQREAYLKEKKLTEKYKNWLEQKQKKPHQN